MARGRGGSHKGHRRVFTNPEELAARNERRDREREWRKQRGEDESESEEDEEGSEEESGDSSDEGGDKESKAKGVEALIEIENPNRALPKPVAAKKAASTTAAPDGAVEVQLSRREREELEKQRARDAYNKLHAEGKTEQARADLARLALIRQQREEAAKKKEQEKIAKEGSAKAAAVSKVAATKSAVTSVTVASGNEDAGSGGAKKKTSRK